MSRHDPNKPLPRSDDPGGVGADNAACRAPCMGMNIYDISALDVLGKDDDRADVGVNRVNYRIARHTRPNKKHPPGGCVCTRGLDCGAEHPNPQMGVSR